MPHDVTSSFVDTAYIYIVDLSQTVSYISRRLTVILRYIKWCSLRCQSIIIVVVVVVTVFVALGKKHMTHVLILPTKKKDEKKGMNTDGKWRKEKSVFSAYLFDRFQEIGRFKAIYSISLFANPIQYIHVIISLYTPFFYRTSSSQSIINAKRASAYL